MLCSAAVYERYRGDRQEAGMRGEPERGMALLYNASRHMRYQSRNNHASPEIARVPRRCYNARMAEGEDGG